MPILTVACVWVRANVSYEPDYVYRLRAAVHRHLEQDYQFVCLTDHPELIPGVRSRRIPTPPGWPGWWSKLELFNPAHGFGGRMLYLDLDSLIIKSLDPIVRYPSSFAVVPHAGTFQGRGGLSVVKKYNTSVMVWDADPRWHLAYTMWNSMVTKRLWGDQDWMAEMYKDLDLMPAEWFPRVSDLGMMPPPVTAKVVLCKKPKNREAARSLPWAATAWSE